MKRKFKKILRRIRRKFIATGFSPDELVERGLTIGKNVFIGENVRILKGVHIGDGAVIGNSSLVTKNVPAHTVYAGNPAKFIKKLLTSEKE